MKKIKPIHLWLFLCLFSLGIFPIASHAQNKNKEKNDPQATEINKNAIEWTMHKSITGAFDIKFPKNYKYKTFPFRYNENAYAISSEIFSSLDGKIAKTNEKSVLVKVIQTFGDELSGWEAKSILDRTAERYVQSAAAIDGNVSTNKELDFNGFLGRDLFISYQTNNKKYGLRIRILMTNYSKIELVLSGPAHTMYSYRADDFFDSLKLYDGIVEREGIVGTNWIEHTSKNNIFTVRLPPKNSDYTPIEPKFTATPSKGFMNYQIIDPVIEKNVIYNITSYKTKKKISYSTVKKILFKQHVSKFVETAGKESLNTVNTTDGDTNYIRTRLVISPSENLPHINTIFIEAQYKGDTLIVQEFLCNKRHASSGLNKTLFNLLKFHPEKYKAVKMEKKAAPEEKSNPKKKQKKSPPSKE